MHKHYGKEGESKAVRYLKRKGYRILEQNYTTRRGEIDIIGIDEDTIAFIEVKTRKSSRYGHPKLSITAHKQRKISMVALEYLKKTKQINERARFDVITIDETNKPEIIELIKNAFELAYR